MQGRRDFLKVLSGLGLGFGIIGWSADTTAEATPLPRDAELTGKLADVSRARMWLLYDGVGRLWGGSNRLGQSGFNDVLTAKISSAPSYLTEYREAADLMAQLGRRLSPEEIVAKLYFEERSPNLRKYVLAEFIRLHLAYGGFDWLPFKNYKGFQGGPYALKPYREVGS